MMMHYYLVLAGMFLLGVSSQNTAKTCQDQFTASLISADTDANRCEALRILTECRAAIDMNENDEGVAELDALIDSISQTFKCADASLAASVTAHYGSIILSVNADDAQVYIDKKGQERVALHDLFAQVDDMKKTQDTIISRLDGLDKSLAEASGTLQDSITQLQNTITNDFDKKLETLQGYVNSLIRAVAVDPSQDLEVAVTNLASVSGLIKDVQDHTDVLDDITRVNTGFLDIIRSDLRDIENDVEDAQGSIETLENQMIKVATGLFVGTNTPATVDALLDGMADVSQISTNQQDINDMKTTLNQLPQTYAAKSDVRTNTEIQAVVTQMVSNQPTNNALATAFNDVEKDINEVSTDVQSLQFDLSEPASTVEVFRYSSGSMSRSGASFQNYRATDVFGVSEDVAGTFYVNEARKLFFDLHIGGDYVDGAGRAVFFRLVCKSGSITTYIPSTTGWKVYKYVTENRLESENIIFTSPGNFARGTWRCLLQVNPGSTSPYSWSSSYGVLSLSVGRAHPAPITAPLMTPQVAFRIASGSTSRTGGWQAPFSTVGTFTVPRDNMKIPFTLHVGGDYVDSGGRTVHYRIGCVELGHSNRDIIYLPDSSGFRIYKYEDHSRLESETFPSVTDKLSRGTYECNFQVNPGSSAPWSWSASYGEITLVVGENEAPEMLPQQIFRSTSSSIKITNSGWFTYPNAAGSFVQAINNQPVRYHLHVGGDWINNAGRYIFYRLVCTKSGTTKYAPNSGGHRLYKYRDNNRLESETMVGVITGLTTGTWSCSVQGRQERNDPEYWWSSSYGEVALNMW